MSEKPNILVIFPDQQRWDSLGTYGNPMDLTPNIDTIAEEGVKFEKSFTTQPICGPARSSLQTGLYPENAGVHINGLPLSIKNKTIPQHLADAGYDLGYIGKWHLSGTATEPVPLELRGGWNQFWRGIDLLEFSSQPYSGYLWDEEGNKVTFQDQYRVDALTDMAIDYIKNRSSDPFFCFLSYVEPHHQNNMNRFVAPKGYSEKFKNPWIPDDLKGLPGNWFSELPDYYGMVKRIDENVGRLYNELDQEGILENTLVVYFSDHGCHFKTRNTEYKRSCHESSIRVPLILRGPGVDKTSVVSELVSLIDLPPTLLEIAGEPIPKYMEGRSLKALLDGTTDDWGNEVFVQLSEYQCGRSIRTDRWKYCVIDPDPNPYQGEGKSLLHPNKKKVKKDTEPLISPNTKQNSEKYVEFQLYDLKSDPSEKINLAGRPEYREIADKLKSRLIQKINRVEGYEPEIKNAKFFHV